MRTRRSEKRNIARTGVRFVVQGPQVYILKAQIGTTPAAMIRSAGLGQPGGPVHWVSAHRGGRRPPWSGAAGVLFPADRILCSAGFGHRKSGLSYQLRGVTEGLWASVSLWVKGHCARPAPSPALGGVHRCDRGLLRNLSSRGPPN